SKAAEECDEEEQTQESSRIIWVITCTHTCTHFWNYLSFSVICWQCTSQREVYLDLSKVNKKRLSGIKKALFSSFDNREK
ncbi:MAG: hypothetical protein ACYSUD_17300, partial [Planctomycetota bacterium]